MRDRTIYHVRSAQSYLHDGELDLACTELTSAVGLAQCTGSTRSISAIREARRQMADHDGEPVVRELDRTLAGIDKVA